MLFSGEQRSECPKFGRMRDKNTQLCPFTGLFRPFFAYTALIPLLSRISPDKIKIFLKYQ